ncbi:MAG: hypothetical protein PHI73_00780 [Patescibacteria group bacterium]|nr:hypothetical protein [Patescibacteria group bacterium]
MRNIELERWYNDDVIVTANAGGLKPGDVVMLPFVVKAACPALGENYFEVMRLGQVFQAVVPEARTSS